MSFIFIFVVCLFSCSHTETTIFLEAESFVNTGGWSVDNQSMMQMGSPYLIAHGLGNPVEDAVTDFYVETPGYYRMLVRTRDWTRPWGAKESPGRFQIYLNGAELGKIFGMEDSLWHWQNGGLIYLNKGKFTIALHDLTGFDARCDAIIFTTDMKADPCLIKRPCEIQIPEDGGTYDLVVVGGGIAGCCTAISAARLGCKVALVHNRPILGGNNSSEVRVGLSGRIFQQPYPKLGKLMDELGGVGFWNKVEALENPETERSKHIMEVLLKSPEKTIHNAGPASNYEDGRKLSLIQNEKNITLFLNTQVIKSEKDASRILSVTGRNIFTGKDIILNGSLFADCTGDANLGYLAGADFRMGRESKTETGEKDAPESSDRMTMGMSVQWYSTEVDSICTFPDCPWAINFDETTFVNTERGDWQWEAGLNNDQITETEYIRDHALRAVYGNWSYIKNHSSQKDKFSKRKLEWVAFIGGKRESRRLLGDYILKEDDLLNCVNYDDATFTTTWEIDLHYPKVTPGLGEDPFLADNVAPQIKPCTVPYRCLYSRNIDNLFMAGRDISATHIALGSIRVMRTGGMMGEVVGMAASICKNKSVAPRDVYKYYFPELKSLMRRGVPDPSR